MSDIITGGQSWEQVAQEFTLSEAYAPALARLMNMEGESITGRRMYLSIPDSWMKPEYAGKKITLPNVAAQDGIIPGMPNWVLGVGLLGLLFLVK